MCGKLCIIERETERKEELDRWRERERGREREKKKEKGIKLGGEKKEQFDMADWNPILEEGKNGKYISNVHSPNSMVQRLVLSFQSERLRVQIHPRFFTHCAEASVGVNFAMTF